MLVAKGVLAVVAVAFLCADASAVALRPPASTSSPKVRAAQPAGARVAVNWSDRAGFRYWEWLEVSNLDGSEPVVLTPRPSPGPERSVVDFEWSPQGSKLAYVLEFGVLDRRSLYVVNADGSGRRRLTTRLPIEWVSWSPDGSMLVLSVLGRYYQQRRSDLGLYVVNVDGSGLRRLPALPPGVLPSPEKGDVYRYFFPVGWQPGRNAFLYELDVVRDGEDERTDLYRMDLLTLQRTQLRASPVPEWYTVSGPPDQLATATNWTGGFRVQVLNADAGSPRLVYQAPGEDDSVELFGWLGDSALLLVDEGCCGDAETLRLIDLETGIAREIADAPPLDDGDNYFIAVGGSGDGELFSYGTRGSRSIEVRTRGGSAVASFPIYPSALRDAELEWAEVFLG